MKLTFLGAAHEVTGSQTLLELSGRYYLVDCGMEQGVNVFENEPLPIAPSSVEAVFLTHAHIDHSGMLPKLYKDGFRGAIYATEATCDLASIMLRDSAHIQESEAEWRRRKAERAGTVAEPPIYTLADAEGATSLLRRVPYDERRQIAEGLSVRFTDVGHLLGSAFIELFLFEDGVEKQLVFSGDVGNVNQPLIRDPKAPDTADYLVLESTYGARLHDAPRDMVSELSEHLQRAFDRGGSVIVPAFAVGRTQELLYALRAIKHQRLVEGHDGFPVYLDSPLAEEATAVFLQCDPDYFDDDTRALLKAGINPIFCPDLVLTVTADQSKQINFDPRSKVILSASGMCDAGRIRHHLKHTLYKKENIILFAGYQAEGTLGRSLYEGTKEVRLFGETVAVLAEISSLHGASGHADQAGLLRFVHSLREKPSMIFVNHGDEISAEAFQKLLASQGYSAYAPGSGSEYDLRVGVFVTEAAPRRINRVHGVRGGARAQAVYAVLIETAAELLALAKATRGRPNKELAKLTGQIRSLIDKWK